MSDMRKAVSSSPATVLPRSGPLSSEIRFWLYYRRLERGRFRWPDQPADQSLAITRRQLQWLLDGLSLEQRQAHAPVTARIAV